MENKASRHLGKLPIVMCECGEEILVISDLQGMVRCIEAHATVHSQKETDPSKADGEYNRIEEFLTQKVIIAISNMTDKQ